MILVIGGTSEGRIAADTLDEGDGTYFYSTLGPEQDVTCARGVRILGGMNAEEMAGFGTLPNFRGKAKRMSNKTEMITVI